MEGVDDDDTVAGGALAPFPFRRTALLAPGSRLGHFTVGGQLATGGSAVIYRAQADDGRAAAIKIPRSARPGAEVLKRFHRERQTISKLQHPSIVRVYETGFTPQGLPFITMELLACGDLADVLQVRPDGMLSSSETIYVIRRCAEALVAAHEAGLIHRDVKPGNLLVTAEGEVKLTDFGIAMDLDDSVRLTAPGYVVGTAKYLAPELFREEAWSGAADIYALGVVAYQTLAGRLPLDAQGGAADQYAALINLKLNADPVPVQECAPMAPPSLTALVNWMLKREPEDRPSAADVLGFLESQLPGHPGPLAVRWRKPS